MLKSYLKKIYKAACQGDATEQSYYSALEDLFKEYAQSVNKKNVHMTTIPKKTEAGNPDFRVWDGKQHIIGYIEAKDLKIEYLDQIETSKQLKRYRHTFPNLILTNFFEFRLYRNEKLIDRVSIGRPFMIHKLKTLPKPENEAKFFELLDKYFSYSHPKIYDAKTLAVELAKRTRFLKDEVVGEELKEEEKKGKGFILGFYEAFKKYLMGSLNKEAFADLYSQTITYGLFAARTRSKNGFNRKLAYDNIPHTIGILRDVFHFISLGDLPYQMEWIIDDISEVLAITDVKNILHQYFHEGKGKDPIVHFYETFLSEYNPKIREKRGVYYTPEPVVSYIVRSLHHILKKYFNRNDGFASESVTVLDPAGGTLTFLAEAAKMAVEEFTSKYGEGGKENIIKEEILKNFFSFELMMAPYAIGHLKMAFLLEELGYRLKKDDRFKLYLTNTLEMEELDQTEIPGMASLSEESHLAGKVKKEQHILVVLGNPPYQGHSANASEKYIVEWKKGKEKRRKIKTWIGELIETYKFVDNKKLNEKNPKWLQDDYVKFIRFAQWKIDQAGEGLLGFITNHGYLDNPTFRGMRQSLMKSFNEIYILDLHGNSRKKEKCPDGSIDENVFEIIQGVAIALFIKKKGKRTGCKVYHADRWGIKRKKYDWLSMNSITTTKWKRLSPKSESYFFIPRDEKLLRQYETYLKVTDIFPVNSVGIVTSRDNFVVDLEKDALLRRINMFINKNLPDELIRETFSLKDKTNWKLEAVRKNVMKDKDWDKTLIKILYRPFDVRWIIYHDELIERSRREVMTHMLQTNLSLCIGRAGQVVGLDMPWNIVFCSDFIEDFNLFYRGGNVNFPLYVYPKEENPGKQSKGYTMMIFEPEESYGKKPNLASFIVDQLKKSFRKVPSPEQIFYYIYAILYSNKYRKKYAEFLKSDFPRIPFTKDHRLFSKMSKYGNKLVELHLLKASEIDKPIAKFYGKGANKVEKLKYDEKQKRVFFNDIQYIEKVPKDVWEYQIGGYQVCSKWLKDRKGKKLSAKGIKHFCKIVTSLQKTIKMQEEIDAIYDEVEKNIIGFEMR